MLIDRIDMKKGKEKRALKEWRRRVTECLERVDRCFKDRLDEAERNTLASVFAVEENALQLCEQGEVRKAISLLKEQEGAMVPVAIVILKRLTATNTL